MIKGWTTDPNANEAYRPSSHKQPQSSPEYHPEDTQDTTKQPSDSETEEYRLRVIVLPGQREKSRTEDETLKG